MGAGQKEWLMPASAKLRRTAVKMYAPYSLKGRVFRALMLLGLVGDKVKIHEEALAALEVSLAQALGEPSVRLAFYNPVLPDRRVLLIMKPEGGVLAYARMAGSDGARRVLEREARVLDRLESVSTLVPYVPKPIAFLDHEGASILITSAGPGPKGPAEWTELHDDFYTKLQAAFEKDGPLCESGLWRHAMSELEAHRPHLPERWLRRYDRALAKLEPYKDTLIPMSLAHRDFVPWNTQVGSSLFVFDWEYAREGYTPNYDYFHFHFVISSNVGHDVSVDKARVWLANAPLKAPVSNEVLLLTYLLDTATFYHRGLEADDFEETDILRETGTLLDGLDAWFSD